MLRIQTYKNYKSLRRFVW